MKTEGDDAAQDPLDNYYGKLVLLAPTRTFYELYQCIYDPLDNYYGKLVLLVLAPTRTFL